jgi:hypothetical protein
MASHEVGMEVREHDMADGKSETLGIFNVLANVALWINNDCCMCLLVANHIGGVRKTTQIVALKEHASLRPDLMGSFFFSGVILN